MKTNELFGALLVAAMASAAVPASAAVQVSAAGGSVLIDSYGAAGFGQVDGFYFVPPLGRLSTNEVAGATGLPFSLSISGNGSNQVLIDFGLTNPVSASGPTTALKFFAKVDPTGDDFSFNDIGSAVAGPAGPGEPSAWSIEDLFTNTIDSQIDGGQLDDNNSCGTDACDVVTALQWDIGVLQPGEIARVRLSLSDNGQSISDTYLTATRSTATGGVFLPEQVLTISGTVQVVPEPGTYAMLVAGIGLLAMLRLRRS